MPSAHNEVSSVTAPLEQSLLENLFELGLRLSYGMSQGLEDLGLTSSRAEIVWRLANHGPLTNVALSRMLHVSPRNVTGLVDALEQDDLVVREAHPTDRRAILLTLTSKGQRASEAMRDGYAELAADLFGDVNEDELQHFATTLNLLLDRLRQG